MAISILHSFLLLFTFSFIYLPTNSHNITDILSPLPQYTQFNNFLTQTKLADDINIRVPVTVLVLNDQALSTLVSKHRISVIKNVLSLHILLDYFDAIKLHKLTNGTTLSTTLYQTTGQATGQLGSVNITDLRGGKIGFGSAVPGSPLESAYIKEVKKVPYSLSVVEISQPIIAEGIINAPTQPASEVNITDQLVKAGCNTFASKIVSTGVINIYHTNAAKGLTVFAPSDEAFKAEGLPDLNKLTNAELVSLLQYHALDSYSPVGTLKSTKSPMTTLATGSSGKYQLKVTTAGDDVKLQAGLGSSRVARMVIDTTPLCLYTVDSVLLPTELFGMGPAISPAPSPETSPTPASDAPVHSPSISPPAPPTESPRNAPANSPADSPGEASETKSSKAANDLRAPALVTVAVAVILPLFLG